jgi:hypothetical protein
MFQHFVATKGSGMMFISRSMLMEKVYGCSGKMVNFGMFILGPENWGDHRNSVLIVCLKFELKK